MTKNEKDIKNQFLEFIEPNKGVIGSLARVFCNNREDVQDLFQDILIQLWHSFPAFRNECKPSTFIYKIAFNVACTRFKTEQRRNRFKNEYFTQWAIEQKQLLSYADDDNREKLYEVISKLSKINKLIVTLYLDDYTHEGIADFIGTSNVNIRVRLHRIKVQLKNYLENENR